MTGQHSEGEADSRQLLTQANEMPYGEARTLVTERALRIAERDANHEMIFDVLSELIPTYRYGGEPAKSLSSFVRMVSEHDAGHGAPMDWAAHTVRWYYKWAISLMLDYPQFSMERITSVLGEMERRYAEEGQSLHAVYRMRYQVAAHLADQEQADRWYAKWIASPADENADCAGCNPNGQVRYLTWRGRDEDAIELAAPVLEGHLTCREQPHSILTSLLLAYTRTGRLEAAVDAHRRAYRVHRDELSDLGQIGTHLRFCALTGNQTRGLEIVERHLPWLDRYTTPDDAADFASDVALLLGRLPADTVVRTTGVRIGGDLRELSDRTEASELAERLLAWAYEIGARFDARNGNSSYTDDITRNQARETLVEYLPLSPYGRARRTAAPITSQHHLESDAISAAPHPAVPPRPRISETDPAALLDLAEEHWWNNRTVQALACWQRFDQVAPTDEAGNFTGDPMLLGRRTEGLALVAGRGDDLDTAERYIASVKEIFAETGSDARWWGAESIAARLVLARGEAEQAAERLRTAGERLAELGESRSRATARLWLCQALLVVDPAEIQQILAELVSSDDPALRASARFVQAQAYVARQQFPQALTEVDRALQDARAVGSERTNSMLDLRAMLLLELSGTGDVEESTIRKALDELVGSAVASDERVRAHLLRGRWLLQNGESEAATPDLAEAVAELTATGATSAECWIDLGEAYLRSERPMDAAEVLEEAIGLIRKEIRTVVEQGVVGSDQPTDPDLAFEMRRTRYLLAQAKISLGERTDAIGDLEAVARAEEALGDLAHAGALTEEWAVQLSVLNRDDEAARVFAAAAEHFASGGAPDGQVRCLRQQGMCLYYGPEEQLALPVFEQARTLLGRHADELEEGVVIAENAVLDLCEAKTLHYLERYEQAHARARSAVAGFEKLGAEDAVAEARMYLRDDGSDTGGAPAVGSDH